MGLENHKDAPLSPSCLSPVSGLVPGKFQVPPATPRECLFSHPLACPSCPTGLPVPWVWKVPGPGRDKGCAVQAPLIADQMVLPAQLLEKRLQ